MAKKKKVVRRAWSKEDIRTLKTMAKDKRGVAKIAKTLRRSPGATAVCLDRLPSATQLEHGSAISLASGRGDMMTPPAKFAAVTASAMFGH
jgi:hypothetical protein